MPNREEKEEKTKTASIHNIPETVYKDLQIEAIKQNKRSLSAFLLENVVEAWDETKKAAKKVAYRSFGPLDSEDAEIKAGGGVPDRDHLKSSVEAFKKEYRFNDYDSALKYQQDIQQWNQTNRQKLEDLRQELRQKQRQHDLLDELLDEEEEWIEHVLDKLKK